MRRPTVSDLLTLTIFFVVIFQIPTAYAESPSGVPTVLNSASELDYPPFAIVQQDGTADGFSVDLLRAATQAVGLSVTFKTGPWNELKQELADKVLDVLPLVSYSEERDKVYDFTTSYLQLNGTIFTREGNTEIKNIADLKNKEVLVMQGDTAHEYALREKISNTIISKVSYEEAFKLLASGKHDAIVVQQIVGLQMIKKLHITNVVPVEQRHISSLKPMAVKLGGFEQKFCFAVPEGYKQLLAQLNEGLAIIFLNGTYNSLYEKWFAPILPQPQVPFSQLVKQVISILIPLLLLVTFFGLWYLKLLVAQRTKHLEFEIQQRKEVDKELLESHDLLANLARQVPGVVYQYRLYPDGRSAFPYASPGMNDIYEVTPEEVQDDATPVFGRLHPDDFDKVSNSIQESARTLRTFFCEFRVNLPKQGLRWRWSQAQPERMPDGGTLWHGIISDITERKEAEKALKSNITKLEVLLGITSLPKANIKTISDHILSSITKLMESEYGFYGFVSEDESIMTIHSWSGEAMENCSMVDKPSDFAICKSGVWAEAVRRREPLIMNNYADDHSAKRGLPAGHVKLANLLVVPFISHGRITAVAAVANRSSDYSQNDVDQLTAFLTSVQAITDSKRAEEELRKSEGHLRTLVQTIPDLIWLKDQDGVYLSCNPIFGRFFGAQEADIVGKTDYDFVDRELADSFVENDRKAMMAGKPTSNEEWITFADGGHSVLLETIKTPMYDSQETLIGVLGIGRDITERRRAEEENTKLQVQLQQSQKMETIGTLAGGIAHDFNNILGAIIGFAEIAGDSIPPESEAAQHLSRVQDAAHRAAALVKQILAFSRQANVERIPLKPAPIIKEAIKLLRPSLPSTITIKQEINPSTRSILADPTQVHQILMNLCTNAFHAMEQTGGILEIILKDYELSGDDFQQHSEIQPGKFVLLSIGDTGSGIDADILDKIFDPYFTTKQVGKGTGMGLAISHGIIASYGGIITCESEIGRDTVFRVYFPAVDEVTLTEVKPVDAAVPSGNEHILLVDDEKMLADLGKTLLEHLGYEVTSLTSSLDALVLFQSHPEQFDAVVTDQTMPGMTGLDLSRQILRISPDTPIIICTGYSSLIDEEKAKSEGIKGFIEKPMVKKGIATLLRKVLDERRVEG